MTELRTISTWFEKGQMHSVSDDVLGIVRQIKALSPRVHVFWNEQGEEFDLVEESLDGSRQTLIFSVKELDARVLERLFVADQWRGRDDPDHIVPEDEDFLTEMDRANDELDAVQQERFRDQIRDSGERLAWALQEDRRGVKASILVRGA